MVSKQDTKKQAIKLPYEIQAKGISKKQASIHIGEYHASDVPTIIYTLLGSCVAVCLYDRKKRIGGMNHILLPGNASMDKFNDCARYGINAMKFLMDKMIKLGGEKKNFASKVFGGANLLPSIPYERCVGKKNVFFVLNFLAKESIPVLSQDVGGNDSRKIFFHTDTGDVFLRRSLSIHYQNIVDQENKALKKIHQRNNKPNDILFF